MKKQIKVVSLFSGIGGFEEGLKKAKINAKVVFASEIDSFAQKSYAANFCEENLYGDIRAVNEKDVPDHSLLLAGFPCQSFSIAGRQKGFEDIRGTLFFDVARILAEKQPKYILLENVKNLISHDGTATIRRILSTLNEIGYTVDFTVINSLEAGVPQNRDRTYICGIFQGVTEKFNTDIRNVKVGNLKHELNKTDFKGFNFFDKVAFKNRQIYIEDILEEEVKESYFFDTDKIATFLKQIDTGEGLKHHAKIIKIFDLPREVHNDLERQRRVYSIKGISPTVLARADSTKILVNTSKGNRIRKITPIENFYIQGFDKHFVKNIQATGMSATQMYKQSGNAVSPPVITGILKQLYEEFISND
jgi:DNA (cytosine-5)-methyltransferase 1